MKSVGDLLEWKRERQAYRRCPECTDPVTVRGFRGEYGWTCTRCPAVGFGFPTRNDAIDALKRQSRR